MIWLSSFAIALPKCFFETVLFRSTPLRPARWSRGQFLGTNSPIPKSRLCHLRDLVTIDLVDIHHTSVLGRDCELMQVCMQSVQRRYLRNLIISELYYYVRVSSMASQFYLRTYHVLVAFSMTTRTIITPMCPYSECRYTYFLSDEMAIASSLRAVPYVAYILIDRALFGSNVTEIVVV